jgi:hypothetical protein
MKRVITVQDTYCPHCTMTGEEKVTVEASFPFTLGNTTCTDASDTPDELNAKLTKFGHVDVEKTGVYRITYRVKDYNGNWNDGNCIGKKRYVRTITVQDTLKPVIGLSLGGNEINDSSELRMFSTAETSPITNAVNPIHAKVAAGKFVYPIEDSMTRRLMTQNSEPSDSWWAIGVVMGTVGCTLVGAALMKKTPNTGWREAGEIQALV